MNKFKYLAKNTMIFGISQFASKIMVFLLLPLYTSYMSTNDYGSADLVVSTISLILPVFTLQITDAVMRFSIENKENSKTCFATGVRVIIIGFLLLLLLIPVFRYFNLFNGYLYLFYLLYIANAVYSFLSYYARAMEKIRLVGIAGVVNTGIVIVSNIVLLVFLNGGLRGYLFSYIAGYFLSAIVLIIPMRADIPHHRVKNDKALTKSMLKYSSPLVPNSISWWGVSSANKFIINGYLDQNILGLYSVAFKIPSIINTIQSIIAEALVLTVYKECDNEKKDEKYFSLLYKLYSFSMILVTSFIIGVTKICAAFLFAKDFYEAWIFVPLLCIPSVWGALSGYVGTFYSAFKKNNGIFLSTVLGGVITIAISFLTVKRFGIYGIMAGNIVSYFAIWAYRWIDIKKFVKLEVNLKVDFASWILLILQAISLTAIENTGLMYLVQILFFVALLILNHSMAALVLKKGVDFVKIIVQRKKK